MIDTKLSINQTNRQCYHQLHQSNSLKPDQSTTLRHSPNTTIHFATKTSSLSSKNKSQCRFHNCNSTKQNNNFTFTPSIHPIPFSIFPKEWERYNISRKEHWQHLIKDSRVRDMWRTQQKLIKQNLKIKQFTFSPIISKFQTNQESNKQNIFNRLHQEADLRRINQLAKQQQNQRQQQQQLLEQKLYHQHSQRFNILNGQKFDLNPLYKRLEKVIHDKKANRKMIAERQMVEYPFQPTINQKSVEITNKKEQIANVVDRLISEYKSKELKISKLREKYDQEVQKELTFHPNVNNYIPIQPDYQIKKTTIEQYTFQPSINPLSVLMTQERQYETDQEKLFRMHNAPIIRRGQKLNIIQNQVYSECIFNPQINQISKQMNSCSHKYHQCYTPAPQTPTHQPKINPSSQCMTQTKRAKSLQIIKKKTKDKAEAYSKTVQYNELKQCSFKPKILNNKEKRCLNNKGVSVSDIAGFKQFSEQMEKVQQKERRRRQLEQKLFKLEKSYDQRMLKIGKKGGMAGKQFDLHSNDQGQF